MRVAEVFVQPPLVAGVSEPLILQVTFNNQPCYLPVHELPGTFHRSPSTSQCFHNGARGSRGDCVDTETEPVMLTAIGRTS